MTDASPGRRAGGPDPAARSQGPPRVLSPSLLLGNDPKSPSKSPTGAAIDYRKLDAAISQARLLLNDKPDALENEAKDAVTVLKIQAIEAENDLQPELERHAKALLQAKEAALHARGGYDAVCAETAIRERKLKRLQEKLAFLELSQEVPDTELIREAKSLRERCVAMEAEAEEAVDYGQTLTHMALRHRREIAERKHGRAALERAHAEADRRLVALRSLHDEVEARAQEAREACGRVAERLRDSRADLDERIRRRRALAVDRGAIIAHQSLAEGNYLAERHALWSHLVCRAVLCQWRRVAHWPAVAAVVQRRVVLEAAARRLAEAAGVAVVGPDGAADAGPAVARWAALRALLASLGEQAAESEARALALEAQAEGMRADLPPELLEESASRAVTAAPAGPAGSPPRGPGALAAARARAHASAVALARLTQFAWALAGRVRAFTEAGGDGVASPPPGRDEEAAAAAEVAAQAVEGALAALGEAAEPPPRLPSALSAKLAAAALSVLVPASPARAPSAAGSHPADAAGAFAALEAAVQALLEALARRAVALPPPGALRPVSVPAAPAGTFLQSFALAGARAPPPPPDSRHDPLAASVRALLPSATATPPEEPSDASLHGRSSRRSSANRSREPRTPQPLPPSPGPQPPVRRSRSQEPRPSPPASMPTIPEPSAERATPPPPPLAASKSASSIFADAVPRRSKERERESPSPAWRPALGPARPPPRVAGLAPARPPPPPPPPPEPEPERRVREAKGSPYGVPKKAKRHRPREAAPSPAPAEAPEAAAEGPAPAPAEEEAAAASTLAPVPEAAPATPPPATPATPAAPFPVRVAGVRVVVSAGGEGGTDLPPIVHGPSRPRQPAAAPRPSPDRGRFLADIA